MEKISSFIYKKNYSSKIIYVLIFSLIICLIGDLGKVYIFYVNISDSIEYHFKILTINSILSGFSLTNLGILISISGDQLIEKLKGTDILIKRNILISYSIIFGSISIFISLLFVLNIDIGIDNLSIQIFENWLFILEIVALFLSIIYFLIAIKKMIQLLSYIYVPKQRYTCDKIMKIKEQMDNSSNYNTDDEKEE
ncbi:MAG: hypothetical protein ACK5JH_15275 [Anaerocolumna sp.]